MSVQSPDRRGPSARAINLWIAFLCLIWGSTWFVIKVGLRDIPPFTGAALRFVVAAIAMSIAAHFFRRREGGVVPPWWLSLSMGTLNLAVSYGIVYWCEGFLPSGLVSLLWAVFPLMMALGGHFYLKSETLVGRQWIGFVVALVGVGLLFATDVKQFGAGSIPAALVLMLSPFVCAISTLVVKRYGEDVSSVLLNRNALYVAAPLMVVFALTQEDPGAVRWTAPAVASVLYLSIIGTVLTFGLYFWLMRYAPANKLSLIAYFTPAIALGFGWLLGGEPVGRHTLLGAAAILGGVFLVKQPRSA